MTITENVFRKREEILVDPAIAEQLRMKSVAAILGGAGSYEWQDFMLEFADSPEQLARLLGADGTLNDLEMSVGRAYLVSNAFFGLEKDSTSSYLKKLDIGQTDAPYSPQIPDRPMNHSINEKQIDTDTSILTLTSKKLTPELLLNNIGPFLLAVAEFQRLIDQTQDRLCREVTIKSISQNSPIELSLKGAADAIEQIKATVVPWRRKHAEKMARLMEQEKRAEIKNREAEILEKQGHVVKDHAEAQKIMAEADKQSAEAERIRLENEKLRIELHRAKIQLALEMLTQVAPNLSEVDKIGYVVKLLPPLDTLASSEMVS